MQHDLTILRRIALNLLRRQKNAQTGISSKRYRAVWKLTISAEFFPNKMRLPCLTQVKPWRIEPTLDYILINITADNRAARAINPYGAMQ